MSDVAEAMKKLRDYAVELDQRSTELAEVERKLEPVETEYERFITDFEVGLWTKAEEGDISKLPSAAMRLRMAHKVIDPELLGKREGLLRSRDRLMKRISAIRKAVDAQRSVLSALKVEMEATR